MTTPTTPNAMPSLPLLQGKVALVTGASRGIGAATAQAFARAGARVVLAARDEQALTGVAQQIEAAGGEALAVPTDIADPEAVARLLQRTLETFGQLHAAFNNAGATHMPTPLAELSPEAFHNVFKVNALGTFLAMRAEIQAMLTGGGGAIVNMSSTAGLNGVPRMAGYAASKHAVIGLTKSAALDYAQHNIRVNAVAPGPIINDRIAGLPAEQRARISEHVPLRRLGTPEEVAATVVWLCSDQAAFITGATIAVDGGRLSGGA